MGYCFTFTFTLLLTGGRWMEPRDRRDAVSGKWDQRQVDQCKFYAGKNLYTDLYLESTILEEIWAKWSKLT